MKFEYVEYLRITDSNSNYVELTLEEARSLREKLNRNSFDETFMTEEEDLNSDVPPEDVEKIKEYMEARSYQLKINWRGEKYRIPKSITDAELEKFERFLEREGALEEFEQGDYHDNIIRSVHHIIFNRYWVDNHYYWEELHYKWQQELKGENNGENN